jgi:hypothetical protein
VPLAPPIGPSAAFPRILKRHLPDVIYRRMIRDLAAAQRAAHPAQPLLAA